MLKKYLSLRWVLLGTAILAILGLTAMNVFSLYRLHQTTIQSDLENKKLQISEFSDKIHHRFYAPYRGVGKLEIEHIQQEFEQTGQFPQEFKKFIEQAASDSIFTDIYFKTHECRACQKKASLLRYDKAEHKFTPTDNYSEFVCDGMGIARTRMKVLVNEYRYNNKAIFDSHYSMTLALINLSEQQVFGYLTMLIDQDYLVNDYLQKELVNRFGKPDSSGVVVWLRDWTKDETVASSDHSRTYHDGKIQYKQRFPDFFGNWILKVAFTESPTIAASKASLIKNFVVLCGAVIILLGAIGFIFVTAQKERALAERQAGFLANVTHELKTPLAVMQAAGENLADGRVDNRERLKSYGRHIHSEALRLKRMIEKLLDVAKADAGQSIIEPKAANLRHLVERYIENHRNYIDSKGFTLDVDIEEPLPPVMIDTDSFNTIIGNLVENAIKYSEEEKYLGIRVINQNSQVTLSIIDRGIGIPNNATKHIFEKFYRVEDSLTAQSKGHGLGLSIVKNLVELNGGQIQVKSEMGSGSRFIVKFPIIAGHTQKNTTKTADELSQQNPKKEDQPQYV
ncbi:HAMP domain-containing histidine kinase [Aliifodinibius sp. S!AR15-10]|uniref:sensor histidine kinase n=1 Tax=Aliifodinibius sp. S!AR15-10 TaxID=2950437 RepID=UPI0028594064|nr:HAMP domain-containing sensor histidine kinase [Aliifodinibius sp. S!AR15-10]MDR8389657.1 HAMP domain-containing histidine kinase [Aliifodinibius sp. S!AR15-10]